MKGQKESGSVSLPGEDSASSGLRLGLECSGAGARVVWGWVRAS